MKGNTWTIMKKEFARFFGDKRLMFSTLFLPGLMIYVVYSLLGMIMTKQLISEENFVAVGYVQNMPKELEPTLSELPVAWQTMENDDISDIQTAIAEKEVDLLVLFPENFMEDITSYDIMSGCAAPNIEIYYNSSKPESSDVHNLLTTRLDAYEASLTNRFDINAEEKKYDMAGEKDITGRMFSLLLPMLLMNFLFSASNSVALTSVAGEKERGTIATLLVTPMKRSSLAWGKIISLSCFALLSGTSSFIGIMLAMPNLMGSLSGLSVSYYTTGDYLLLLGIILSTVLLLVALISNISAYAKTLREASNICSPLMILTMLLNLIPLMGNKLLHQTGLYFIPVFNSVLSMNTIFSFQADTTQVLITIATNIFCTILLTVVLSKLFNSEKAMFAK